MLKSTKTTGYVSGTVVVHTKKCYLTSVQINTDGANTATITVYDSNGPASGKVVFKMTVIGSAYVGGRDWMIPLYIENGIVAVLNEATAEMAIEYMEDIDW